MSATRTSAVVVFLSLGFFTTSAFRGGSIHANCECGTPCCLCRIARSRGSRTSHPSSLHSRSWNGALPFSPFSPEKFAPSVSRASKLASESLRENTRRARFGSPASADEEEGSDGSRSVSPSRVAASSAAIAVTPPGTPEPSEPSEPFADALWSSALSPRRDGDDAFSFDRATPATSTSTRSTLSRLLFVRCVL